MTDIRAAGGGSSQILLMDVRTGKHIHATRTLDSTGFESISFFRGGRRIVTSSVRDADHRGPLTVRFWDADRLLPIARSGRALAAGQSGPVVRGEPRSVTSRDSGPYSRNIGTSESS